MDSDVVAGVFTVVGVLIGGGLTWAQSAGGRRRDAADQRDEQLAAMGSACQMLMGQARLLRNIDTRPVKMRQALHGVMDAGSDIAGMATATPWSLFIRVASAAGSAVRYASPAEMASKASSSLVPLLGEITALAVRLSLRGPALRDATQAVAAAAGALLSHLADKEPAYEAREEALYEALGQLRDARDADAARWSRRPWRLGRADVPGGAVHKPVGPTK